MEKQKLALKPIKNVSFDYGEMTIEVIPYINPELEVLLITQYIETYLGKNESAVKLADFNYIGAEYGLMLGIVDNLTNISIVDDNGSIDIELSDITCRDLYTEIVRKINNFGEFMDRLHRTVADVKEQVYNEKSIGKVIDNIYNKTVALLEKLSEIDLSEDGINKLKNTIVDLANTLENSPIKPLLEESVNKKPSRKKSSKKQE